VLIIGGQQKIGFQPTIEETVFSASGMAVLIGFIGSLKMRLDSFASKDN